MGEIVFLLLLIAIRVALSYAGQWMEWRNRAVAVIQLVSRIGLLRRLNTERSLGHVDGWRTIRAFTTGKLAASPSWLALKREGTYHVADFRNRSW